jgi:O-acetyl-ADP-ribose deacetylase (regulator of RNase III)
MKLQLVSLDRDFIESASDLFGSRATCKVLDIKKVSQKGAAFVSPANSLGIMDGGIDLVLSRDMFPGCEERIQSMIRCLGDRPYIRETSAITGQIRYKPLLRVGSAMWLPVGPEIALIVAPTMIIPHDVADTQNAYWAFIAALVAMDRIEKASDGTIHTLVCTSLCCGVGRMDPEQSAIQMRRAWDDFHAGRIPEETEKVGDQYVLMPSRDDQQPSNYDNHELGIPFPNKLR